MYYDPTDPFNNFPLPPYNNENPQETLRGCLINVLILLVFMVLAVTVYFISKLF